MTAPRSFVQIKDRPIILASASPTRAAICANAGLAVSCAAASIDEQAIKHAARAEAVPAGDVAVVLAEMKAETIARRYTDPCFVIGCDQILSCAGEILSKPESMAAAKDQLAFLSGKTHELLTAAVVFRDGQRVWHHVNRSSLTVRSMSSDFIEMYLDHIGAAALSSPGCYQIEGAGAQIFSSISGCHYSILGLPLLELLAFLREHGLGPHDGDRTC